MLNSAEPRKILFAIHDAHPWGGQDKYTLEIARWISKKRPVELHAYSVNGVGDYHFKKVRPNIKRPVLLKSFYYHLYSSFFLQLKDKRKQIINAMGACSLKSDVVQVLFLHRAWRERQKRDPVPGAQPSGLIQSLYHGLLQKYDLWTEYLTFRSHKKFIAISKTVAKEVIQFYPKIKQVEVVYPGIDPIEFAPIAQDARVRNSQVRASLNVSEHELLFLFVGSFERKGLGTLLQSLGRHAQGNWKLAVIGRGDIPRYKNACKELALQEKVIFLGSQKKVASYFQAADFFIFPTVYEPFGMVSLEAMACGCVPVVSSCAGAAELIEQDKNGLLIQKETNVDEISEIIGNILTTPERYKNFARAARATAEEYSWEQVAERYLEIIERI